jgi:chromate reductase, NAD(P)H dehydrogenase (quinone)
LKTSETISVICCTNRPNNLSSKVARWFAKHLEEQGGIVNYFSLEDLPKCFPEGDLYGARTKAFSDLVETHISRFSKLVFVIPEYNASFPGVFKSFIDALPKETWSTSKIALIGTSTGRGGNARGIDHLTNILHYLGANVFGNKMLVSSMLQILDGDKLTDVRVDESLKIQAKQFIEY